jgi:hypothetical protein
LHPKLRGEDRHTQKLTKIKPEIVEISGSVAERGLVDLASSDGAP